MEKRRGRHFPAPKEHVLWMKKENKYIGHSSLGRCKIKTLTSFVVYNQVQSFLILREKMDLYVDWYVFADPAVENCYYLSFE